MMFKGLHQRLSKTAAQQESAKHPHAAPVESASILLAPARRQEHLRNIKSLLHLPPKLYDTLYYRVIERFVEFVQSIPETQHGAFSNSGGFLDHGLERASRALTLCLSYFFPEEQSFHSINSEQALWIYAVFTAGLLLDVGKLAVKYQVTLCNKEGSTIKDWLPYSGSMVGQAKFYKFTYIKQNRDHLRRLTTGLLARQLLTEADTSGDGTTTVGGFNWIASNPVVLEAWLNMLYGDTRNITSYLTVLPYADQLAIENQLKEEKALNLGKQALFNTSLFDTTQEHNPLAELAAGQAFRDWIRQSIDNGALSVNQDNSLIHRTEEGLIIAINELADQFAKDNPQYSNVSAIKTEFMKLMELHIVSLGETGRKYAALTGTVIAEKFKSWLSLYNPAALLSLQKNITVPVNPTIAKTPGPAATQPVHTPTEPKQQHNAQLQHR